MFSQLEHAQRLLLEAELIPVQGDRFQPTGFADLGAATYQLADGTMMLLVESAQSVANRLEATILTAENSLIPELAGLSYVEVEMTGASNVTTNSLVEAHRLNSPFIISDEDFKNKFKAEADVAKSRPLNWQKIARTVFKYDVNSLIHGLFLANLEDGRVKTARALSGFIEARGIKEVVSGGVKNNPIDPSGKLRAKNLDKDVYGNVPYQRVEYTARKITAYFNLDLNLLRGYALGQPAFELLVGLSLYKIRRFLDRGLRLRTACDLRLADRLSATVPHGYTVHSETDLLTVIREKIVEVRSMFADPPVTTIRTEVVD